MKQPDEQPELARFSGFRYALGYMTARRWAQCLCAVLLPALGGCKERPFAHSSPICRVKAVAEFFCRKPPPPRPRAVAPKPPVPPPAPPKPAAPVYTFVYAGFPGEGVPVLIWKDGTRKLNLYKEFFSASGAAGAAAPGAGAKIPWNKSVVVTLHAGRLVARRNIEMRPDECYGKIAALRGGEKTVKKTFALKTGDEIENLSYRAEGYCYVRIAGEVCLAKCPGEVDGFKVQGEAETEFWLRYAGKSLAGWFPHDPTLMDQDRKF